MFLTDAVIIADARSLIIAIIVGQPHLSPYLTRTIPTCVRQKQNSNYTYLLVI